MSEKRELTILTGARGTAHHSPAPHSHAHGGHAHDHTPENATPSSLVQIQPSAPGAAGKEYWRSLDELSETSEFKEFLHREFPQQASEWDDPQGRRRFLKLMGASIALAGLSSAACTVQPEEKILPYVKQPEEIIPGKPLFYATAMPLSGAASALLVESHEGRPTKIEGNPEHPHNRGAAGLFEQASILTLYDPDRSQTVTHIGDVLSWTTFMAALRQALEAQKPLQGAGLRILTGAVSSPTLANQLKTIKTLFPAMKIHHYEPVNNSNAINGAKLVFGEPVEPVYRFDKAKVIFSLDADFLLSHPANLRYIGDFVTTRSLREGKQEMSRFYAVETCPTNTGAKADHRLALRASDMEAFARSVAARLGVEGAAAPAEAAHGEWIGALADDLQKNRGAGLIIVGPEQPPAVHALAYAMNGALGNVGSTVNFVTPLEENAVDHTESIKELVNDINGNTVDTLVILGGNPVYDAPADLNFVEAIQKVSFTAHLSLYNNETSAYSQWHIPEAHYLESWSDVRFPDGTVSFVQPLIAPLYQGKSAHEVLTAFTDKSEQSAYDIVREFWLSRINSNPQVISTPAATGQSASAATGAATSSAPGGPSGSGARTAAPSPAQVQTPPNPAGGNQPAAPSAAPTPSATAPAATSEDSWRKALHDGVIANSTPPPRTVAVKAGWASLNPQPLPPRGALELVFRSDPSVYDGRFANNGWLQELPKPVSKLTWGNAAHVSPATAREKGLANGEVIEIKVDGRSVQAPVWIMPGHADNSITVALGYGRTRAGRVGDGVGFNAYAVRTTGAPWLAPAIDFVNTGTKMPMATTQDHWSMEGRHLVRDNTLEAYLKKPDYARHLTENPAEHDITLYNQTAAESAALVAEVGDNAHRWGMAIDLNNCVGCNACVVACQSENNIPVVGKEQVLVGREMHWLRVDRYYKGHEENNPEFFFQPLPCMHCELAPCEVVCPVAATVHSAEGLNDMVYNRCVGTRYCANNCPYKVRRFNFFLYQDFVTESIKLQRNPDVTVRSRGIMEKCTYCVQRVQEAKIEYEKLDQPIPDGAIKTACQQTCPADAIVFGDLNDPNSRVNKLKAEPRDFGLLQELNTRPRTTYLAEVRNPHPSLKRADAGEPRSGGGH